MTRYSYTDVDVAPVRMSRRLISNVALKRSTLTGVIQTIQRPGERWELDAEWELYGDNLMDVLAFFHRLNGAEHRVVMPQYGSPFRGAGGGSPVVDGASQTGGTLSVRSGPLSTTDWLKAGDLISYVVNSKREIKMATTDVTTDGSGLASIPIVPAIRSSPSDGAAVSIGGPDVEGDFILVSPVEADFSASRRTANDDPIARVALSFVEDVSG